MRGLSKPIQILEDIVVTRSVLLGDDALPLLWRGVEEGMPRHRIRLVAMAAERVLYAIGMETHDSTNVLTRGVECALRDVLRLIGEAAKIDVQYDHYVLDDSVRALLDPDEKGWVRWGKHDTEKRLMPLPETMDGLVELEPKAAALLANRMRIRLLADAGYLLKRARLAHENELFWDSA